uniref:RH2 domain-containing protein n=1 Tax=Meloidogyne javanica TaxID=6303 RepID=A0A915MF69_MELJA
IQKLQTENKCMKEQLSSGQDVKKEEEKTEDVVDEQLQTLIELRKMTHTQKDQIKQLQKDLDTYCCEVESLRENIERLIRQNKELLRKNGSLQKQGRMLLLERAEILKRLQQSEENTLQLRRVLNETNRACKDLEVQKQWDEETALAAITKGQQSPRFSLSELRDVLQEKNALKVKVLELEEKMEQIRASSPGGEIESNRGTPSPNMSSEECLVFGPINREPDEKLHPWKYERMNSGVRRFFRLFASISSTNLSPRRPSGAK